MWREQRVWTIDQPLEALDGHPLQSIIKSEMAQLRPFLPDLSGYTQISPADAIGKRFVCGDLSISFGATGAITHLTRVTSGNIWASEQSRLFELRYQALNFSDFAAFYEDYFYDVGGAAKCTAESTGYPCGSYGKPGLNTNGKGPKSQLVTSRMTSLYHARQHGTECLFQIDLAFPTAIVSNFGAPARTLLEVKVVKSVLHSTLRIFNKTSTRRPEAMWLTMQPPLEKAATPQIVMNKLGASCDGCDQGSWIDAMSVVHNGSQRVHAVSDLGVEIRRPGAGSASFVSRDSALVRIGADELTPLPMPSTQPNTSAGFAFNLWNNVWGESQRLRIDYWLRWILKDNVAAGTNYVMWYPFDEAAKPEDRNLLFRVELAVD
jgi:hypothetical protein